MSRAPYKYLDYYTFEDADLFFGREEETQRMVGEILSTRLLVLFSPSGSGKTSLINAGVRPQLENMGYQTIYTRLETEPISSVCNAVARALEIPCDGNIQSLYEFLKTVTSRSEKPLVIFLDQFEEFFTVFREQRDKRKEFIDQLARIKYDDQLPVFVVLSLREDYFVNLHEFREAIPSIFQNNANLRLEPFTDEEAKRAIVNPLRAKDIHASIEGELLNELINDLKDSQPGIEPIKLQIVCHTLWEKKPKETDSITLSEYQSCGRAEKILSHHVQDLLNKIPKRQHGFMVRIFETLKTEEDTKRLLSFGDLQKELKIKQPERLTKMLDKFADLHLLRFEEKEKTKWYEFKHDYLVGEITKWIKQRKDQLAKKRFRYAIAPGIVLALVLLIWAIIEFNRFEARFTNQEYAEQQREVYIKRRFNPFGFRVTTGILYGQLKDTNAKNAIQNGFIVSIGIKNDWRRLIEIIYPGMEGREFYFIGIYSSDVDKIIEALRDSLWNVRFQAVRALGNIGKADDRVIIELAAALSDQSFYVGYQAATELGNLGQADHRVIAALMAALKNQNFHVGVQAAVALVKLYKVDDRAITVLILALKDQYWDVRYQAAAALGKLSKADDRMIDALVAALKDPYIDVRFKAAAALGKLSKANDRSIVALVAALGDQDSDGRSQSAAALFNLGKSDDQVIAVLKGALNDQSWIVRYQAATVLVNLSKVNDCAIAALVAALSDKNSSSRFQAAEALGELGQADAQVYAALRRALRDEDTDVRSRAAAALINLGNADYQVIAALRAMLKDKARNVRSQAASALGNLGQADDQVYSALRGALSDQSWDVRFQAADALGNLGQADSQVIALLVAALKNQESHVRSEAASALGKLGQTDDQVIAALVAALNDQDSDDLRSESAATLGKLGQVDTRVIKALVAALDDNNSDVCSQAARALESLGQADDQVITALLSALNHQIFENLRSQAAAALGKLGQANDLVIQALLGALNDQFSDVRSQAAAALGKLLRFNSHEKLFEYLTDELSGYRTAGAQALARQDSITDYIKEEINRLKDHDKRPWVRLGAWEAYELIQQRLTDEKVANQFIDNADSLFQINNFWQADDQYQSAFDSLMKIIRIDSVKIARTKFQQARCTAKMKRLVPTLDHLEIAFQYDKAWRDTLRAELAQKESEWGFMKGNWYLKEVLLK